VVRGLKSQLHHDVAVGGPTLAAHAIRAGLVDEYHLFVAPVIIGGGKPAMPGNVRVNLELQDERGFDKGMVIFAIALSGPDGDKVKPTPRLLVREPPANEEVYLTPGCATRS
jgi:hypothetical protein